MLVSSLKEEHSKEIKKANRLSLKNRLNEFLRLVVEGDLKDAIELIDRLSVIATGNLLSDVNKFLKYQGKKMPIKTLGESIESIEAALIAKGLKRAHVGYNSLEWDGRGNLSIDGKSVETNGEYKVPGCVMVLYSYSRTLHGLGPITSEKIDGANEEKEKDYDGTRYSHMEKVCLKFAKDGDYKSFAIDGGCDDLTITLWKATAEEMEKFPGNAAVDTEDPDEDDEDEEGYDEDDEGYEDEEEDEEEEVDE